MLKQLKFKTLLVIAVSFIIISCQSIQLPDSLQFEKVFPSLEFDSPIDYAVNPLDDDISYVVGHKGFIWKIDSSQKIKTKDVILDLSSRIDGEGSESGLLKMVFHPAFAKNKKVIISYTNKDPKEDRISSFCMTDKGIDIKSEKIHFKLKRPFGERNLCQADFGPDGYLYIAIGDGGKAGDPDNNGQNLETLFGSILRIDINHPDKPYVIPKDNPFIKVKGARPEIWAYGFRVPWRFGFDQKTGFLYCADVGEMKIEEVNIVKKGGNYGWRIKEGKLPFKGTTKKGVKYIEPILSYGRQDGLSITGGYVYRGKIKNLQGVYIYCDYITNNFWGLRFDGKKVTESKAIANFALQTVSFAQDKKGEIYVCSFRKGNIYKIIGTEDDK